MGWQKALIFKGLSWTFKFFFVVCVFVSLFFLLLAFRMKRYREKGIGCLKLWISPRIYCTVHIFTLFLWSRIENPCRFVMSSLVIYCWTGKYQLGANAKAWTHIILVNSFRLLKEKNPAWMKRFILTFNFELNFSFYFCLNILHYLQCCSTGWCCC